MPKQVSVLERAGLAFICVTYQVTGHIGLPVKETPFEPCGKTGAPAATQARFDDLLLNLSRCHLPQSFVDRLIASMMPVDLKGPDTRYVDLI